MKRRKRRRKGRRKGRRRKRRRRKGRRGRGGCMSLGGVCVRVF